MMIIIIMTTYFCAKSFKLNCKHSECLYYVNYMLFCILFFSPPENDSFRKDLCFAVVFSFFSPRNLRAPSADRREIWEGKKRSKIGAIYDNFRV